jgi:hypothetical protein
VYFFRKLFQGSIKASWIPSKPSWENKYPWKFWVNPLIWRFFKTGMLV